MKGGEMEMASNAFRPEKYGMVFCPHCHGSGKVVDGKAPCQKCGGFGLLIGDESQCLTILWGDHVGLKRVRTPKGGEKMIEIRCPECGNDHDYELVKCLSGRVYEIKCEGCGHVFVVNGAKDELSNHDSQC
jgi:DnaJ-class molecular chaperone